MEGMNMEEIRDMIYPYNGANCTYFKYIKDDKGYVTCYNDYMEIMYKGPEDSFTQFVGELLMKKWV
jgi:hypothetical protein